VGIATVGGARDLWGDRTRARCGLSAVVLAMDNADHQVRSGAGLQEAEVV